MRHRATEQRRRYHPANDPRRSGGTRSQPTTPGGTATRGDPARRRDSGIAFLWTAVTVLVLVGFVGLAVDTAFLWYVAHQLQNAADAASLAGAQLVREDIAEARAASREVAGANAAAREIVQCGLNEPNLPDGDIVVGFFDRGSRTFTPSEETPRNAVRVVARRTQGSIGGPVPLLFMRAFGFERADVQRDAVAMVQGGVGAGIVILDPAAPCSFDVRGTSGELIISGGAIAVDSSHATAACHAGQPSVTAEELMVVGGTSKNFLDKVDFEGDLYQIDEPVGDPLAGLLEPSWDPAGDRGKIEGANGESRTFSPGYYSQGLVLRNGDVTLEPGIYVLDGAGLDVNGGNLYAEGVMFYVVDSTPGDPVKSSVDLRGNGIVRISPPDLELHTPTTDYTTPDYGYYSAYEHGAVSIFQARNNTNPSRVLGTSSFSAEGTMYFPSAHLEIGGESQTFSNGLIANTLLAHGDGQLVIDYDDRFPRIPRRVFIVE